MSAPILWDDFRAGEPLGDSTQVFEPALAAAWQRIFGKEAAGTPAEAAGVAVALMMRGYLAAVAPRPPGNVHARQRFTLEALPVAGEAIRTVVSCAGKEIRRERRYVDLDVRGTSLDGRAIYAGVLTIIWAA
jgi:hypothetical protein